MKDKEKKVNDYESVLKSLKKADDMLMKYYNDPKSFDSSDVENDSTGLRMARKVIDMCSLLAYNLNKVNEKESKDLLSEIEKDPEKFFTLESRYFSDYGFCAKAMETAVKGFSATAKDFAADEPLQKAERKNLVEKMTEEFKGYVVQKVKEERTKVEKADKKAREDDREIEEETKKEFLLKRKDKEKRNKGE